MRVIKLVVGTATRTRLLTFDSHQYYWFFVLWKHQ